MHRHHKIAVHMTEGFAALLSKQWREKPLSGDLSLDGKLGAFSLIVLAEMPFGALAKRGVLMLSSNTPKP